MEKYDMATWDVAWDVAWRICQRENDERNCKRRDHIVRSLNMYGVSVEVIGNVMNLPAEEIYEILKS